MTFLTLQSRVNLTVLYNEPHRKYHNLNHINDCLAKLEQYDQDVGLDINDYRIIETALWFHDAVYNPKSSLNEHNSTDLIDGIPEISKANKLGIVGFYRSVADCIMVTKNHIANSYQEKIVCDIDLSILGAPTYEYALYLHGIKEEYKHMLLSDFKAKRKLLLQKILERKYIYHTDYFREMFEQQARENLYREINF